MYVIGGDVQHVVPVVRQRPNQLGFGAPVYQQDPHPTGR